MQLLLYSLNKRIDMIKTVIIINVLLFDVLSFQYPCSHDSVMKLLNRPTYEFSLKILDRVSHETSGHFVFAPMSAWLQLVTLAEGAGGDTLAEIWKVTKHERMRCFRRKLRDILNVMDEELILVSKRCSVIIVDKLFRVKSKYKYEIEKRNGVKVLSLDFNDSEDAAYEANSVIESCMEGMITEGVYPTDFNLNVLLLTDVAYFRSDWKHPFNRAYTTIQPFFSEQSIKLGDVRMMHQVTYLNLVHVPFVNAEVLELPCSANGRVSMLVVLPAEGTVYDVFYSLKYVRVMTIFNLYKQRGRRLVDVKLPRFKIITDIDTLPELVYDMGVKRIFYPHMANFSGISDYGIHASLMSQISDIDVVEEGISARSVAESLLKDNETVEFNANRPFVFLIVDRETQIIMFAGSYNAPSVY